MFKKVVESRFEPKPMFHYSHMVAFMFALPKLTTGNSGFSLISIPLLLAVVHWLSKSWIGLVLCHLQTFALATFLIAWVASSCGLRLQMTWVSGLNGVRKEEGFIHQLTFSIGQRLTPWDIIALSPYISPLQIGCYPSTKTCPIFLPTCSSTLPATPVCFLRTSLQTFLTINWDKYPFHIIAWR